MGPEAGVTVTHAVEAGAAGLAGMYVDSVALRKAHAPDPSCDLRLAGAARVTTAGMPTAPDAACAQQLSSSASSIVGEASCVAAGGGARPRSAIVLGVRAAPR